MKKTNVYYRDDLYSYHYLLMSSDGSYFMWETDGIHHANVQDAINYMRGLGVSNIHCDVPRRERRRS